MAHALDLAARHERELEGRVEARTREVRDEQARTALALARERQAATEQREFISMVSHEFRTPLAIIDGAAQVASLSADDAPEDVRRQATAIRRGTRRMLDLLNTWLTRERLASGLTTLNPEPVALAEFLSETVRQAGDRSPEHPLTFSLDGLAPVYAFDRELVRIALRNLIDNAIKYSPEGGPVQIQGSRRGDRLCLAVEDQGLGIPADQLDRVATRFFRARNTETIPGLGLGLHLVRVIAELHGGSLELHSREGAGTTARLLLPAGPPAATGQG
jgi:signal transduction histidine kinase